MKTKQGGFTLVEIMIVLAIIGLLAAMAIPAFVKAREKSQQLVEENRLAHLTPQQRENENLVKLEEQKLAQQKTTEQKLSQIRPFGHNIYEFPFVGDEYRFMLSAFQDKHPELRFHSAEGEVVGVQTGSTTAYGATASYTVHFDDEVKQ